MWSMNPAQRKTSTKFLARVFIEYYGEDSTISEVNVWVHELYPDELSGKLPGDDWVRDSLWDLVTAEELAQYAGIKEEGAYELLFGALFLARGRPTLPIAHRSMMKS